MNNLHPGESLSLWSDTEVMTTFSTLKKNINVDICVVGGGIAGLTTAYLLLKEGRSVALLESFELGSGQSGKTTAHFCSALDDRYFNLEKIHGVDGAKLAYESHTAAIDKVEDIVRSEAIHCDLERLSGYLFTGPNDTPDTLKKEVAAMHRAGFYGAQILQNSPFSSFDTGSCLHAPDQLQLHPLKYLAGLTQRILNRGGQIYTQSHVVEIHGGKDAFVKTKDGFVVHCNSIVVATNTPINDTFAIHTKQAPYRSYVLGFHIPKYSMAKALYWDTANPYHYLRIDSASSDEYDILIVGGEDHKTGQEDDPRARYSELESWTRSRFPFVNEVLYRWSGQVMEPVDGLAYLGHNPMDRNNIYVITGDSGNGMTHGTIGAMLITDQILGRKNPWEKLYNPSRISLRATGKFFRENSNVAAQYGDWLVARPKPDLKELPPNEGLVYRDGVSLIAVYKDAEGNLEYLSPSCPHLAGVVAWNRVEKSWDCPCHGSRFDCHGKVIEGPAFEDLKKVEVQNDNLIPIEESLRQQRSRLSERMYPVITQTDF